ncbi:hypothetical protein [Comamonas sp.]|uniref:hypothetical protein n=1 Tax=Comamonas sp. TaxID=34028 RepID=UPI0012D04581|nr:hypothetical protein [Comamonas sp.]MPS92897.1 hypothetical protein [Comamonas sp.]
MVDMKNQVKALIDLVFKEIKKDQATDLQGLLDKLILMSNCDGVITAYKVVGLLSIEEAKLLESELDELKRQDAERIAKIYDGENFQSILSIIPTYLNQNTATDTNLHQTSNAASLYDQSGALGGFIRGTSGANPNQIKKLLDNVNNEMDYLEQIVIQMVSPVQNLSTELMDQVKNIIRSVIVQNEKQTTISDIANSLKAHEEEAVRSLGKQLAKYTAEGPYGKFFGSHNPDLGN